ncbi:uncharacterized protein LOC127880068 isoform X2 [Dreissena polymorpha]|nr:uncharacterized protein LOC127880068 isoform X2 [Dreissena polymorpha]
MYSGVKNSYKCFCGSTLNTKQQAEPDCMSKCTGDSKYTCGDPWSISVYTNWACGSPPVIAHGKTTLYMGPNITYGSIADVECDPGFISKPTITCLSNNSWENVTCELSGFSSDATSPGGSTLSSIHEENSITDSLTTAHFGGSTTMGITAKNPLTKESTDSTTVHTVGVGIGEAGGLLCAVGAVLVIIVLRRRDALSCKYGTKTDNSDKTNAGSFAMASRSYDDTIDSHNYFIQDNRTLSVEDTVDHYNTADEKKQRQR